MTRFDLAHLSISTRRKLASILLAIVIFAFLAGLTTLAVGRPIAFGVIDAILVGLGIGLFEEFYVQTLRGRWLRRMYPFGSICVYIVVVVVLFLVAIHWNTAIHGNKILRAVDGVFAAVRREHAEYHRQFGVVPTFRVGIHGGDVVVSQQGDTKRAIGVYGDPINIAARMEDAACAHEVACVISGHVADALDDREERIRPIGDETVKGISAPIPIYEYRPEGE